MNLIPEGDRAMSASAEYLKSLADHFAPRDWDYTRQHKIERIRYTDDFTGRKSRWNRLRRYGLSSLFGKRSSFFKEKNLWREIVGRYYLFKAHMTEDNVPDGALNSGGVITFWEEDGEYIQMVQPSVGLLLADFLLADPEHPHAVIIQKELDRISARYTERCNDREVEGRDDATP